MAALRDVLGEADDLPTEAVVFATRPWSPTSEVIVSQTDAAQPGYEYLLEVELVLDVLEVWSAWRGGAAPDPEEASRAVIYYAQRDTYLPVP